MPQNPTLKADTKNFRPAVKLGGNFSLEKAVGFDY